MLDRCRREKSTPTRWTAFSVRADRESSTFPSPSLQLVIAKGRNKSIDRKRLTYSHLPSHVVHLRSHVLWVQKGRGLRRNFRSQVGEQQKLDKNGFYRSHHDIVTNANQTRRKGRVAHSSRRTNKNESTKLETVYVRGCL